MLDSKLKEFISELAKNWWIECTNRDIDLDPSNTKCVNILENLLRDDYKLDEDFIEYITEIIAPNRHTNVKGNTDSGVNVADDETAVSAHIDDFEDEEDEAVNEADDKIDIDVDDEESDDDTPAEDEIDPDDYDSDGRNDAEADIQKNSLTAVEKDHLKKD